MPNPFSNKTRIPRTDLEVPFTSIGTMMFGGRSDRDETMRTVDAALENGLNFFDAASAYQNGKSEELMGEAMKGRRDRFVVTTKVGYGKDGAGEEEGLSPESIRRVIDQSLGRMQTDYVDIYYFHRPDYVVPIEISLAAMGEVIGAGKARAFGISNYSAWQSLDILNLCEKNGWPCPVISQMIYNPLLRQIECEYVSFARKHGMYLTVYNPLAGGLLTGKYADLDDEDKGARFIDNEMYRKRYWSERMFEGMNGLLEIARSGGVSLTHLTLNWIRQKGKVSNILLGPSNHKQLLDCLKAGESDLSDETIQAVDNFLLEFEGTNASYAR
ncbi:aldo/keto reductase [bacterium]|nr:aldo/keto reductase [bacterium]